MARSDWRQTDGASTNHFLDDNTAYQGKTSLKVKSRGPTPELYEKSIEDAPTEGRMTFYARRGDDHSFTTFWRFQDVNSYYTVSLGKRNHDHSSPQIFLGDSGGNIIDNQSFDEVFSDSTRSDVGDGLAEGEYWEQRDDFVPYRVDFWTGEGDDVRAAVFEDADADGEWTRLANELVDENPNYTDGGGVGLGGVHPGQIESNDNRQNYHYWIDQTEIYY